MNRDIYGVVAALLVGFIVVMVTLAIVINSNSEKAAQLCMKYNYGKYCQWTEEQK